ncbi:MAG: hypothetical protein LC808_37735 [Actinobacteria bacterium]|nr:hypothetical protein [Actinomycetota bacterium]
MTTRADMINRLSPSSTASTKTYVVEVHTEEPAEYLCDLMGATNVEETSDAFLYRAYANSKLSFWVDQLDERFWSFHTRDPVREVLPFLKSKVEERRDLDWMWLPSEHLRNLWPGATTRRVRTEFHSRDISDEDSYSSDLSVQLTGRDAEQLLDYIARDNRYKSSVSFDRVQAQLSDSEFGVIDEALNRRGRFAMSGESVEFHLQFVQSVVNRYRAFVEACEKRAFLWTSFDAAHEEPGGLVAGGPIVIDFSKPVPSLERMVDVIFSSRHPYRLWGIPEVSGDMAHIEAVDLHVGRRIRMDLAECWLRVYLEEDSCGNTVARLISNLQSRFDSALRLRDPDLQAALTAHVHAPRASSN